MSFALEFYNLSWDALKAALVERKPDLLERIAAEQWSRLLDETDLGQSAHHLLGDTPNPLTDNVGSSIRDGLDAIAEAMARNPAPGHEPPELDDTAALVFAAVVRQLGKPVGAVQHDGSVVRDQDGELPMDFRSLFLDGVAASCFKDHMLGENLAARPLFGLFHLDFLSWGGLTQAELARLMADYGPPSEGEKADEEWRGIAPHVEAWLADLVAAMRAAAAAKTDLVTLYLTVQEQYGSFREELADELAADSSWFGKLRAAFGR